MKAQMMAAKKTAKKPAKKNFQRRWKVGQEYKVEGTTGERRLVFVGRGKYGDRELLLFHPVRKASKNRLA